MTGQNAVVNTRIPLMTDISFVPYKYIVHNNMDKMHGKIIPIKAAISLQV